MQINETQAQNQTQNTSSATLEEAIFAGGCFWCMEDAFEHLPGVVDVVSGYTGGHVNNPTYEQVSSGSTGHAEAIRVRFNPAVITYPDLLKHFWVNIDPTTENKQFCDEGTPYRSAIFTMNDAQKKAAEASRLRLMESGKFKKIYTLIEPAKPFYLAEDYHQNYNQKNPLRYKFYKNTCGRPAKLKALWGDPAKLPD